MALTNPSAKETTVKDMVSLLPSDMWSLDRVLYYCKYNDAAIVQCGLLLEKFRDYFSQYLDTVGVDEKYYYCPQRFAEDFYGDAGLDFLVLYFAGMTCNLDFCKPSIKVLRYDKMKEINQMIVRYKNEIDGSREDPPSYTISKNASKDFMMNYEKSDS